MPSVPVDEEPTVTGPDRSQVRGAAEFSSLTLPSLLRKTFVFDAFIRKHNRRISGSEVTKASSGTVVVCWPVNVSWYLGDNRNPAALRNLPTRWSRQRAYQRRRSAQPHHRNRSAAEMSPSAGGLAPITRRRWAWTQQTSGERPPRSDTRLKKGGGEPACEANCC